MRLLLAIALVACAHSGSPRPVQVVVVREACETQLVEPAIQCADPDHWRLRYDGCRWRCLLLPVEQPPARLGIDVLDAQMEQLGEMGLCATQDCEEAGQ